VNVAMTEEVEEAKAPYHHGNLKAELLTAAIDLLRKHGPAGLSLREVAKVAGVSHSAPYRHFADKSALLAAVARQGFLNLAARLEQVAKEYELDPKRQLIEAGVVYVELAVQNPEVTQLMFGGFLDIKQCSPEVVEDAQRAFNGLLEIVRNGQKAGIYRDREPMNLTLAAWSIVHGLAMLIAGNQLRVTPGNVDEIQNHARAVGTLLMQGLLLPK
jgi:AcrR family transcriptional regulator